MKYQKKIKRKKKGHVSLCFVYVNVGVESLWANFFFFYDYSPLPIWLGKEEWVYYGVWPEKNFNKLFV